MGRGTRTGKIQSSINLTFELNRNETPEEVFERLLSQDLEYFHKLREVFKPLGSEEYFSESIKRLTTGIEILENPGKDLNVKLSQWIAIRQHFFWEHSARSRDLESIFNKNTNARSCEKNLLYLKKEHLNKIKAGMSYQHLDSYSRDDLYKISDINNLAEILQANSRGTPEQIVGYSTRKRLTQIIKNNPGRSLIPEAYTHARSNLLLLSFRSEKSKQLELKIAPVIKELSSRIDVNGTTPVGNFFVSEHHSDDLGFLGLASYPTELSGRSVITLSSDTAERLDRGEYEIVIHELVHQTQPEMNYGKSIITLFEKEETTDTGSVRDRIKQRKRKAVSVDILEAATDSIAGTIHKEIQADPKGLAPNIEIQRTPVYLSEQIALQQLLSLNKRTLIESKQMDEKCRELSGLDHTERLESFTKELYPEDYERDPIGTQGLVADLFSACVNFHQSEIEKMMTSAGIKDVLPYQRDLDEVMPRDYAKESLDRIKTIAEQRHRYFK